MARRALCKNISMLTDIGDIPYDMIRPVLLKLENPAQLELLEEASPQLYGADEEIWIALIKRDIPKADEKIIYPRNPKDWRKVYHKMLKDHQKEVEEDAMKLKEAYHGIKAGKKPPPPIMAGTPHIPKLGKMQLAHNLPHNQSLLKKREKKVQPVLTVQRFGATSKKELTGKGVMEKVRREAMEERRRQKVLSTPTHHLNAVATQIVVPPRHMVEQYRKSPPPKPLDTYVPMAANPVLVRHQHGDYDRQRANGVASIEDRERRLRALTNPTNTAKAGTSTTPVTTKGAPAARSTTVSGHSARPRTEVNTNTMQPLASSTPSSSGIKRKAENPPIVPSIENDDVAKPVSRPSITSSPPQYRIPQFKSVSPEGSMTRPHKKKAPVKGFMNVFLPATKKRRVA
ncbi:MAG: hypothetical protein Q9213_003864 [Squamulea squamosa]